jgi:hypothetical protein
MGITASSGSSSAVDCELLQETLCSTTDYRSVLSSERVPQLRTKNLFKK